MKVAVIAPPYPLEEAPAPPLGVTYVAAAFEAAGAEVRVLDYIVSRYSAEKLRRELEAFQPDLVGSTSVTMNFPVAAEIVEAAKAIRPSAVTAMGGPHVTFDAENTLRTYPGIDLLVLGEGERTVAELLPLTHDRGAWSQIKGIAFLQDGRFVRTGFLSTRFLSTNVLLGSCRLLRGDLSLVRRRLDLRTGLRRVGIAAS